MAFQIRGAEMRGRAYVNTSDWSYHRYNYGSMKMLLEDFPKYSSVQFKGVDTGRREATDALVYLMNRYYRGKGYVLTDEFVITADYTPKMLPKRYDYGIAYTMKFTLNINGKPYQDVQDVRYEDEVYSVSTKDVTLSFPVKTEFMEKTYVFEVKDDNREQTKRDMAVDEEEVSEPEVQGLEEVRSPRNPRVSRVARL